MASHGVANQIADGSGEASGSPWMRAGAAFTTTAGPSPRAAMDSRSSWRSSARSTTLLLDRQWTRRRRGGLA